MDLTFPFLSNNLCTVGEMTALQSQGPKTSPGSIPGRGNFFLAARAFLVCYFAFWDRNR